MYDANYVAKMLKANWDVVGCNFTPADPRAGIPATIELELQASDGIFWPMAP
ncbi:hypothetical protein P0D75_30565 [Paraburkholderia sediminicola]|uniref:hypothetical protein n=1 Tax=Paraburkholderia sediminicola TaxID=458836 RepID=UPI0038BD35E3